MYEIIYMVINMKKIHKRYIIVGVVLVVVCVLVYKLSTSYALKNNDNNQILTGDDWSLNITSISTPKLTGDAQVTTDLNSIGNNINFSVKLPKKSSSISYDVVVKNMGKLDAELFTISLFGLTELQKEYINYTVTPVDYIVMKSPTQNGSILKNGQTHKFNVSISYQSNVTDKNIIKDELSLGLNIIYSQPSK